MSIQTATLADGSTIKYHDEIIGEGAMKQVYFTEDKSSVICLYKNQNSNADPNRISRLEAILGKYNPTLNTGGDYFKQLFCWTTGIVLKPQLGIVTPAYPSNYFFESGFCKGKEKESTWFVRPKIHSMLPNEERGDWIDYLKICILLARAIRRLHQAGLAHSDLSNRNVLIDPTKGKCLIIDIDSLVVPGLFPPDVLGTRGYIAPEVLSTVHLPLDDPQRKYACITTDLHALPTLIYQYLLLRHPLEGPKINSTVSAEEDDLLSMGSKALFIEHPHDNSNRPKELKIPYTVLGSHLSKLFEQAFVKGLHSPNQRPTALQWEKALVKTWDLLYPCQNQHCSHKWFILENKKNIHCPFCHSPQKGPIPILRLRSQKKSGQWMLDGQIVVYNNLSLFKWHILDNIFPGEEADRTPQAYCVFYQGKWLLINQNLRTLTSPSGNLVSCSPAPGQPGQAIELKDGEHFRLSQEEHGRIAEVQIVNV